MAKQTVNDMNDPERRNVTIHATYQMERMLEVVLQSACVAKDVDMLPYLLRGVVPRLLELNSLVMSAAGDDAEDVISLKTRLSGGWLTAQQATA